MRGEFKQSWHNQYQGTVEHKQLVMFAPSVQCWSTWPQPLERYMVLSHTQKCCLFIPMTIFVFWSLFMDQHFFKLSKDDSFLMHILLASVFLCLHHPAVFLELAKCTISYQRSTHGYKSEGFKIHQTGPHDWILFPPRFHTHKYPD